MSYDDDNCWHDIEGHLDQFIDNARRLLQEYPEKRHDQRNDLNDIPGKTLADAARFIGEIMAARLAHADENARKQSADAQVRYIDNQQLAARAAVLRGFTEWTTRLVAGVPVEEVHRRANRALGAFNGGDLPDRYPSFPPNLYPAPQPEQEK